MKARTPKRKAPPPAPPRILVVGAHPDDPEVVAGGLAARWTDAGAVVKFLSMTNGDAGHHETGGGALARRRYAETQASAGILGISYDVADRHDGELVPSLDNRRDLIRRIREFRADLVLTHPPDDYHPDHRYTSQLVQDAAMSVMVPNVCPLTPCLRANPVFAYIQGTAGVTRGFAPDFFFDIGPVLDRKLAMLGCHVSQFHEWIPWLIGTLDRVPAGAAARAAWVAENWKGRLAGLADRYRAELVKRFGAVRGMELQYVEAVEICAYGARVDGDARRRLFPFTVP